MEMISCNEERKNHKKNSVGNRTNVTVAQITGRTQTLRRRECIISSLSSELRMETQLKTTAPQKKGRHRKSLLRVN